MPDQPLPGSRENPLPVPEDILSGKAAWLGTFKNDSGLFWCKDDGQYYQYPPDVVAHWHQAESIRLKLHKAITVLHVAYEDMQKYPDEFNRRFVYEKAREDFGNLACEHWTVLLKALYPYG